MILKKITPDHKDYPALKKLFEEAFPESERPFSLEAIISILDQIPRDLLGVYPYLGEKTPILYR